MASSSEFDTLEVENLGELFNKGLAAYNEIENTQDSTSSSQVQKKIQSTITTLEQATRLVSYSGVFSRNEGIQEVATNDLQYFLLPALLGSLTIKLTSSDRKNIIECAEMYFKDFLQRCNDYELTDHQINKENAVEKAVIPKSEIESMIAAANTRENKIQRFKKQKELKSKLANLKENMANEHADEDIKRDYFITMIKSYVFEVIEELNSINMERPILEHMAKMKKEGTKSLQNEPPPPRLKPIIITKDEVQKAVFGAGYPSLPTMTVQEFYEKRVQDGIFPDPNKKPTNSAMTMQQAALAGVALGDEDKEAEEKENKIEDDDSETMARMRQMDEYKDEHRRGWGNRMNRS